MGIALISDRASGLRLPGPEGRMKGRLSNIGSLILELE